MERNLLPRRWSYVFSFTIFLQWTSDRFWFFFMFWVFRIKLNDLKKNDKLQDVNKRFFFLEYDSVFVLNIKDNIMIPFFMFAVKACSAGYFGESWNSSCGHCLNAATCHHIIGTCDEECNPGYQEPYCKDGIIRT